MLETSKSHWTELSAATSKSNDEDEQLPNNVMYENLNERAERRWFFRREPYELKIGGKIAERGQAEIFEASASNKRNALCYVYNSVNNKYEDSFGRSGLW